MNGEAAFVVCATILIILFAGDPDLVDALIVYFGG